MTIANPAEVFPILNTLKPTAENPPRAKLAGQGAENLKEQIAADIEPVFSNLGEFAEEANFNGTTIRAVIEEISAEPFDVPNIGRNVRSEGIFGRVKILYASEIYFSSHPLNGDRVRVNGELWIVSKVTPEGGMLVIELKAVGS